MSNAANYLKQAEDSSIAEDFIKAFDLYLKAFTITPQLKLVYERQFLYVYNQLVDSLEQADKHEELFQVYKQVLVVFPGHVDVLNDIGGFLLKNGFYMEAWNQFQQVLTQNPGSVIAQYQIDIIKSCLVERWHYRMLNDKKRNYSYRDAIHESVAPGQDSVVDLGTGSGILAMYVAECSPADVTGIETSDTLCEIAQYVVKENKFDNINIVNKSSHSTSDRDIGGKKDLLVTEVFDAGLFGEGILSTLNHAFKNLLKNNARVVPCKAEYFVRAVKSDSLMTRYYLSEYAKSLLKVPFDHVLTLNDSYDCVDIDRYKDLKYMTDPCSLVIVDFNNVEDIQTKLNQTEEYTVNLKPLESGEVSTLIGWFNLHLTNNICITTNPIHENRAKAWQQTVFCNFLPKKVNVDDEFTVKFQLTKGSRLDLVLDTDCDNRLTERIVRVSESVMRFLNDEKYMEIITSCVDVAFAYLQEIAGTLATVAIADLSPFPMFGLMMLKKGVGKLYCQAKTKEDQDFIKNVFQSNSILSGRYKIIDCEHASLGKRKFHAIFFNIFDDSGNIDRTQIKNTFSMKVDNLADRGLFMPYCISVMGQLINSPWLNMCNRAYDENIGYSVAHHINKFQLSTNYGLDFTQFEYTPLTDPVGLGVCGGMKSGIVDCTVLKDGCANAILCWYDIELLQNCGYITTKRPNSFLDGVAFLADPAVQVTAGDKADVICSVDKDQSFKFLIDIQDK